MLLSLLSFLLDDHALLFFYYKAITHFVTLLQISIVHSACGSLIFPILPLPPSPELLLSNDVPCTLGKFSSTLL